MQPQVLLARCIYSHICSSKAIWLISQSGRHNHYSRHYQKTIKNKHILFLVIFYHQKYLVVIFAIKNIKSLFSTVRNKLSKIIVIFDERFTSHGNHQKISKIHWNSYFWWFVFYFWLFLPLQINFIPVVGTGHLDCNSVIVTVWLQINHQKMTKHACYVMPASARFVRVKRKKVSEVTPAPLRPATDARCHFSKLRRSFAYRFPHMKVLRSLASWLGPPCRYCHCVGAHHVRGDPRRLHHRPALETLPLLHRVPPSSQEREERIKRDKKAKDK
jgi:hypothetical protein